MRTRETSSEKFGVGERSRGHSIRLEAGQRKTGHEDGGRRKVVMVKLEIGVREKVSRCRVVGEDQPADRTWTSAGEGAGRSLGRSAGRRT